MGCGKNEEIMAALETEKGEEVIFSTTVTKFNRWGMKQDRTLLLTNDNLYNIKKNQIQRKINIDSIKAITKSLQKGNQQFIVHIKSEYDYMFESDARDQIFQAIKFIFFKKNQQNLPVFGVHDKLKDYATSKKDISNGVEVHPKDQYRLAEEDVFDGSSTAITFSSSGRNSSNYSDEVAQFNDEVQHSVA